MNNVIHKSCRKLSDKNMKVSGKTFPKFKTNTAFKIDQDVTGLEFFLF